MGRGKKKVFIKDIDRRETGYYSTPEFVAGYMARRLLSLNPEGEKVLDPCCGQGELLSVFQQNNKEITGIDIADFSVYKGYRFIEDDFIKLYGNWKSKGELPLEFDYYIANPPYNCHEVNYIRDNKKQLGSLFSDVGTHNMYSMFVSALIDCAKPGAVIGIIVSDSWLTSKYHQGLREKILKQCSVHEIIMCPTDLFSGQGADVRTSIVILQKGTKYQNKVAISDRCLNMGELKDILENRRTGLCELGDIILRDEKDNNEIIIDCPEDIRLLFRYPRLGESYKCVTGISTGNDSLYISESKTGPYTIPFYKNPGLDRFYTDRCLFLHKDFLRLDKEVRNFLVRNKELLFRQGITCSSMGVTFTACYLPPDSTYGVNANIICEPEDIWWLLAYLNSRLVTYFLRGILIRGNMVTSGYVSRIPLIPFSAHEREELDSIGKEAYSEVRQGKQVSYLMDRIDRLVFQSARLSDKSIHKVMAFNKELIRNT